MNCTWNILAPPGTDWWEFGYYTAKGRWRTWREVCRIPCAVSPVQRHSVVSYLDHYIISPLEADPSQNSLVSGKLIRKIPIGTAAASQEHKVTIAWVTFKIPLRSAAKQTHKIPAYVHLSYIFHAEASVTHESASEATPSVFNPLGSEAAQSTWIEASLKYGGALGFAIGRQETNVWADLAGERTLSSAVAQESYQAAEMSFDEDFSASEWQTSYSFANLTDRDKYESSCLQASYVVAVLSDKEADTLTANIIQKSWVNVHLTAPTGRELLASTTQHSFRYASLNKCIRIDVRMVTVQHSIPIWVQIEDLSSGSDGDIYVEEPEVVWNTSEVEWFVKGWLCGVSLRDFITQESYPDAFLVVGQMPAWVYQETYASAYLWTSRTVLGESLATQTHNIFAFVERCMFWPEEVLSETAENPIWAEPIEIELLTKYWGCERTLLCSPTQDTYSTAALGPLTSNLKSQGTQEPFVLARFFTTSHIKASPFQVTSVEPTLVKPAILEGAPTQETYSIARFVHYEYIFGETAQNTLAWSTVYRWKTAAAFLVQETSVVADLYNDRGLLETSTTQITDSYGNLRNDLGLLYAVVTQINDADAEFNYIVRVISACTQTTEISAALTLPDFLGSVITQLSDVVADVTTDSNQTAIVTQTSWQLSQLSAKGPLISIVTQESDIIADCIEELITKAEVTQESSSSGRLTFIRLILSADVAQLSSAAAYLFSQQLELKTEVWQVNYTSSSLAVHGEYSSFIYQEHYCTASLASLKALLIAEATQTSHVTARLSFLASLSTDVTQNSSAGAELMPSALLSADATQVSSQVQHLTVNTVLKGSLWQELYTQPSTSQTSYFESQCTHYSLIEYALIDGHGNLRAKTYQRTSSTSSLTDHNNFKGQGSQESFSVGLLTPLVNVQSEVAQESLSEGYITLKSSELSAVVAQYSSAWSELNSRAPIIVFGRQNSYSYSNLTTSPGGQMHASVTQGSEVLPYLWTSREYISSVVVQNTYEDAVLLKIDVARMFSDASQVHGCISDLTDNYFFMDSIVGQEAWSVVLLTSVVPLTTEVSQAVSAGSTLTQTMSINANVFQTYYTVTVLSRGKLIESDVAQASMALLWTNRAHLGSSVWQYTTTVGRIRDSSFGELICPTIEVFEYNPRLSIEVYDSSIEIKEEVGLFDEYQPLLVEENMKYLVEDDITIRVAGTRTIEVYEDQHDYKIELYSCSKKAVDLRHVPHGLSIEVYDDIFSEPIPIAEDRRNNLVYADEPKVEWITEGSIERGGHQRSIEVYEEDEEIIDDATLLDENDYILADEGIKYLIGYDDSVISNESKLEIEVLTTPVDVEIILTDDDVYVLVDDEGNGWLVGNDVDSYDLKIENY